MDIVEGGDGHLSNYRIGDGTSAVIRELLLVVPIAVLASDVAYRVASVDASGQLHITLEDGRQVLAPKLHDQVAFESPLISPDHQTVGWLVEYPDPSYAHSQANPIAGALILYRNGRIVQKFSTGQVFWDWRFQEGGKEVVYSTGPTHGGATECVLRDVVSGRVMGSWRVTPGRQPPTWAEGLRR